MKYTCVVYVPGATLSPGEFAGMKNRRLYCTDVDIHWYLVAMT